MNCPKCGLQPLIQKNEVTKVVKFRVVTYENEVSKCDQCDYEFFTPKQLDMNNESLKKAYQKMIN